MIVKILSQGITADTKNSVGDALQKFFDEDIYTSVTILSAFASAATVERFAPLIEAAKATYPSINLIVGVDQKGTPKEALEAILTLDINAFVFHQKERPIFHPKIYRRASFSYPS